MRLLYPEHLALLQDCSLAIDSEFTELGPQSIPWQIYVGCIAATIPFIIGASEFAKRIVKCSSILCYVHAHIHASVC